MNWIKWVAPDTWTGKILVTGRMLLDIGLMLARQRSRTAWRLARIILSLKPRFTMVTNGNLLNLYSLVADANRTQLAGAVVECGVWNGGSAAMMRLADVDQLQRDGLRTMWLFDSFQGLPRPGARDGQSERDGYFVGLNRGRVENVQAAFRRLRVPFTEVKVVPGWFNDTLASAPVGSIALLHVDADWYDSVKVVLDVFYDKVTPGGYVVFDDYGYWQGCTQAVADFLSERGLGGLELVRTDRVGAYFRKPDVTDREA